MRFPMLLAIVSLSSGCAATSGTLRDFSAPAPDLSVPSPPDPRAVESKPTREVHREASIHNVEARPRALRMNCRAYCD